MIRGRKRKTGVKRSANGKSRGEPEVVHPETVAVRERMLEEEGVPLRIVDTQGQPKPTALDPLASFTLGKLLLRHRANPGDPGSIDDTQYETGTRFMRLVYRYYRIQGLPLNIRSPGTVMVSNSDWLYRSDGESADEEEILRVRARFRDCFNALAGAARTHTANVLRVTSGVCIENWPVKALARADYGDLRVGLNALGRVLK